MIANAHVGTFGFWRNRRAGLHVRQAVPRLRRWSALKPEGPRLVRGAVVGAVAALVVLAGCASSAPADVVPAFSASPAPRTATQPAPAPASATAEAAESPEPSLPLPPGYRLNDAWIVEFRAQGRERIREILVMTPTCAKGPCDV